MRIQKYKEIKRRLKDDLDVQMRDKMLKSNEELKRNREFDYVVLQHVENMINLEKEREHWQSLSRFILNNETEGFSGFNYKRKQT